MNILVSACLLGEKCRYNGQAATSQPVLVLKEQHTLVPFCPEQLAGLPAPRPPCEIAGSAVLARGGMDVTGAFHKGAALGLALAKQKGCTHAVLKQNSPSCGCGVIYDGTFTGKKIPGDGIATTLLKENGIRCTSDEELAGL